MVDIIKFQMKVGNMKEIMSVRVKFKKIIKENCTLLLTSC